MYTACPDGPCRVSCEWRKVTHLAIPVCRPGMFEDCTIYSHIGGILMKADFG